MLNFRVVDIYDLGDHQSVITNLASGHASDKSRKIQMTAAKFKLEMQMVGMAGRSSHADHLPGRVPGFTECAETPAAL